MGDFKDLIVYKKAYQLAKDIHLISRQFPPEERYSLTDQLRRSSRSVCANLAEGYRKRRYKAHFLLKLSDAEGENAETSVWLNFAVDFNYINTEVYKELSGINDEVGKLLTFMLKHPEKFL
ncbi:MAG: four helix bundle protein [Ferruginibacter sp.]